MSENLKYFLGHISTILHEIVQITVQYKDEPQLGLQIIVEMANREGFTFTKDELEAVIVNYERLRNQQVEYDEYENIGFPKENADEIISNALQYFDKTFIKNLVSKFLKKE